MAGEYDAAILKALEEYDAMQRQAAAFRELMAMVGQHGAYSDAVADRLMQLSEIPT